MKAIQDMGIADVRAVKTARRYLIEGKLSEDELDTVSRRLLVNPIIQHVMKPEQFVFPRNPQYSFRLNHVDILKSDIAGLAAIGQQFGFSDDELKSVAGYFRKQGRTPTDA